MKWKWKISFYYCKDKVASGRRFAGKYALQCHNKAHGMPWLGVAWHGALHCIANATYYILDEPRRCRHSNLNLNLNFEFLCLALLVASVCTIFWREDDDGWLSLTDCLPACMHFIYALANNSTEPEECCRSCSYLGNETPPPAAAPPPPPPRPSSSYCHHQKLLKRNYGKREMIIEYSNNIMFAWA